MPYYMFKGKYSTKSIASLVANPEDREAQARKLIEAIGGKLHHLFFCFGDDDVIALIEAPDDETMAAGALIVGASGTMSAGGTTKLMTSQEAMAAMKKAGASQKSYQPVGG